MPLEPGTKLGRFEIVSPLRSDALGESYKASDTERKRAVTLRIITTHTIDNSVAQRLEQDSRIVTSLNHPHIASVYEVGRHEETTYMVTEYIEGETLAERLQRGPLELEEGLKVAIAVADALDKAHRKGLAHRNLCPASIILTTNGVKLADFGLAAPASSLGMAVPDSMSPTRTSPSAMATPTAAMPYQAPEQISGKEADSRADLFSLGAILYEMAAGKPAFEGKTQALLIAAITSIDPEPLPAIQPLTPPALDYIVRRCLAKTPQKRLQTAWDLLCQLRWIADGGGGNPEWTSTSPQKKRERLFRVALAAAGLLVLVLTPLAYLGHRNVSTPFQARYILTDLGFMRPPGGSTVYISPNGHWLITSRATDDPGLDAMALDSVTKQSLLNGMAVYTPFWKPDSEEFAFWSEGKLKRASVSGGPATNTVSYTHLTLPTILRV